MALDNTLDVKKDYFESTGHIRPENIKHVILTNKYLIQNRTTNQQAFMIRFLRLFGMLNNLYLGFNNNDIPYLPVYYYSRHLNRPVFVSSKIKCCLYKKNIEFYGYKGNKWVKPPRNKEEYIITLACDDKISDRILYLFSANCVIYRYKYRFQHVYLVEHIKKLFSYYYLKNELYEVLQFINMPKELSGIIYEYCLLEY